MSRNDEASWMSGETEIANLLLTSRYCHTWMTDSFITGVSCCFLVQCIPEVVCLNAFIINSESVKW